MSGIGMLRGAGTLGASLSPMRDASGLLGLKF
jgi:hypothetical protein